MSADPVRDDEILYRLVHPNQIIDGNLTSGIFRTDHSDGLSMFSARHVRTEDLLENNPSKGLASVTGADVKASGAVATRDTENAAHVLINGPRSFPSKLKLRAKLVALPPPPPASSE